MTQLRKSGSLGYRNAASQTPNKSESMSAPPYNGFNSLPGRSLLVIHAIFGVEFVGGAVALFLVLL